MKRTLAILICLTLAGCTIHLHMFENVGKDDESVGKALQIAAGRIPTTQATSQPWRTK